MRNLCTGVERETFGLKTARSFSEFGADVTRGERSKRKPCRLAELRQGAVATPYIHGCFDRRLLKRMRWSSSPRVHEGHSISWKATTFRGEFEV